jgi:hypothetical protein
VAARIDLRSITPPPSWVLAQVHEVPALWPRLYDDTRGRRAGGPSDARVVGHQRLRVEASGPAGSASTSGSDRATAAVVMGSVKAPKTRALAAMAVVGALVLVLARGVLEALACALRHRRAGAVLLGAAFACAVASRSCGANRASSTNGAHRRHARTSGASPSAAAGTATRLRPGAPHPQHSPGFVEESLRLRSERALCRMR